MLNQMVEREAQLDRTLTALSDGTRRAILARLRRGPATISELASPFDMSLEAVSKHVRVLERAGLLSREIRGREHHCSLEGRPLRQAASWLERYRGSWDERLDALQDHLETAHRARRRRKS